MKVFKVIPLCLLALSFAFALAFASGNAEKGKELFNDPKLGGSTNEKSCATCHPGGSGLEGVTEKKEFKSPAGTTDSLKTMINKCVTMALKGKALNPDGQEMSDMIAYLGTLKAKE